MLTLCGVMAKYLNHAMQGRTAENIWGKGAILVRFGLKYQKIRIDEGWTKDGQKNGRRMNEGWTKNERRMEVK